jgi:hypothetical protein
MVSMLTLPFVSVVNAKERTGERRYFAKSYQYRLMHLALWGYKRPTEQEH